MRTITKDALIPMDKMLVERGMSRLELARQSGVPARTLEAWAKRTRTHPDVYQLLKVSKVLGCSIEDLLEPERYGEDRYSQKASPEESATVTE